METLVTSARLRERVSYDPNTGVFARLTIARGGAQPGSVFGTLNGRGYLIGMIDYRIYLLHRLAWFWVHGEWPPTIDHINGTKTDNRIVNLRAATMAENNRNVGLKVNNSSGLKGVSWDSVNNRWRAGIKANGKTFNLGLFAIAEDAHEAYVAAAVKYHGAFARAK